MDAQTRVAPRNPFVQFGVERPVAGMSAVRVAGELSAASSARLVHLVDTLLARGDGDDAGPPGQLLVDLHDVAAFGQGGMEVLRSVRRRAEQRGVTLLLTGLAERRPLLPRRVVRLLDEFDTAGDLDDLLETAMADAARG